jgi:hypothetical protein
MNWGKVLAILLEVILHICESLTLGETGKALVDFLALIQKLVKGNVGNARQEAHHPGTV